MNTVIYPAIASGEADARYRAEFVDLPGVVAEAHDMDELVRRARESLLAKLRTLSEAGEDWPAASSLEKARAAAGEKGALLMIDVEADDAPVRVNISLGERLLRRIDAAATAKGMTRSRFIANAARAQLGDADNRAGARGPVDFETAAHRLQEELSAFGRRLSESFGPDSTFSRQMAEWDRRLYDTVQKTADNVSAAMARRKERYGAAAPSSPTGEGPEAPAN